MTEIDWYLLDLCSGGGGFHLAASTAGFKFKQVFYSDINEYANKIYKARFPNAIAIGDLRNIRRENFPEGRYIITAGFPCQPFSNAGSQLGINDDRYLWHEILRLDTEFRPHFFIHENVVGIESVGFAESEIRLEMRRYQRTEEFDYFEALYARQEDLQLGECCQNLADAGAIFQTYDIPAISVNAWHRRRRIWIVGSFAHTDIERCFRRSESGQSRERQIHSGCRNDSSFGESAVSNSGGNSDAFKQRAGQQTKKLVTRSGKSGKDDSGYTSDNHEQRKLQSEGIKQNVQRRSGNGSEEDIADIADSKSASLEQSSAIRNRVIVGRSSRTSANDNPCRCKERCECKSAKSAHAGIKLGFSDDISDDQSVGQKESRLEESLRLGQTSGFDAHSQWKRHWLEVATELCRSDDGLRNELDIARLRHDIAGLYPNATEKDIERAINKLESKYRRQRIELLGNSIVPQIAEEIFRIFRTILEN